MKRIVTICLCLIYLSSCGDISTDDGNGSFKKSDVVGDWSYHGTIKETSSTIYLDVSFESNRRGYATETLYNRKGILVHTSSFEFTWKISDKYVICKGVKSTVNSSGEVSVNDNWEGKFMWKYATLIPSDPFLSEYEEGTLHDLVYNAVRNNVRFTISVDESIYGWRIEMESTINLSFTAIIEYGVIPYNDVKKRTIDVKDFKGETAVDGKLSLICQDVQCLFLLTAISNYNKKSSLTKEERELVELYQDVINERLADMRKGKKMYGCTAVRVVTHFGVETYIFDEF